MNINNEDFWNIAGYLCSCDMYTQDLNLSSRYLRFIKKFNSPLVEPNKWLPVASVLEILVLCSYPDF